MKTAKLFYLGFVHGNFISFLCGRFDENFESTSLTVTCSKYATLFSQCDYDEQSSCTHYNDVGLICSTSSE